MPPLLLLLQFSLLLLEPISCPPLPRYPFLFSKCEVSGVCDRKRVNVHSLFGSVCVCEHMLPVQALPNTLLHCAVQFSMTPSVITSITMTGAVCSFFTVFFVLLCGKVGAVAVEALHSLTLLDTFGCCCCGRALPLSLSTSFSLARVTFEESDKKSGGAGGVQRVESPLFGDHLEAHTHTHTVHSVTTQRLIDSLGSEFCCCCDMFCATKQTHSLPLEH